MKLKRKKKKNNTPRTKRMKKDARLQSAKSWISKYTGKNIAKGYMKRYAVDELRALLDLRELGMLISDERIIEARKKIENKVIQRRKIKEKKKREELEGLYSDSDETFYYIAGYTSGGFPYGITWDEIGEEDFSLEEDIF